jgi:hypothetical protein
MSERIWIYKKANNMKGGLNQIKLCLIQLTRLNHMIKDMPLFKNDFGLYQKDITTLY